MNVEHRTSNIECRIKDVASLSKINYNIEYLTDLLFK